MRFKKLVTAMFASVIPCAMVVAADTPPSGETVAPQFQHAMPNIAGKTFTSAVVNFPPGARAAAHRHGNAFVYAYVLSGSVRSQVDEGPAKTYRAGED